MGEKKKGSIGTREQARKGGQGGLGGLQNRGGGIKQVQGCEGGKQTKKNSQRITKFLKRGGGDIWGGVYKGIWGRFSQKMKNEGEKRVNDFHNRP